MATINTNNNKVRRLIHFMQERHYIYLRRKDGAPFPWTRDKILRTYRFCNIYRELDTVTIWIRKNIRERWKNHPHLWFMLCIARQINWPDTLKELIRNTNSSDDSYPWPCTDEWDWKRARKVMRDRGKRGDKVYTGAYILNAQYGHNVKAKEISANLDKPNFTCKYVLDSVWKDREYLQPIMSKSIQEVVGALSSYHGWGGFMSYEVACDLRYTRYLRKAKDIMTFANAGPGAKRGLNRLTGRDLHTQLSPSKTLEEMVRLLPIVQSMWPAEWPRLELREIEHSLCEFDKYERTRLGEGRPRSIYKPK